MHIAEREEENSFSPRAPRLCAKRAVSSVTRTNCRDDRSPATPLYVSEFAHGTTFPYNWEIARILFKNVTGAEGPNAALPIFGKEGTSTAGAKPRPKGIQPRISRMSQMNKSSGRRWRVGIRSGGFPIREIREITIWIGERRSGRRGRRPLHAMARALPGIYCNGSWDRSFLRKLSHHEAREHEVLNRPIWMVLSVSIRVHPWLKIWLRLAVLRLSRFKNNSLRDLGQSKTVDWN